jgi:hypothetical protein
MGEERNASRIAVGKTSRKDTTVEMSAYFVGF